MSVYTTAILVLYDSSSSSNDRLVCERPDLSALPYRISVSAISTGEYSGTSPRALKTLPSASGKVDVGNCTRCGGCLVRYNRSRASSAAYVSTIRTSCGKDEDSGLTRYSAIFNELPKPSPSWSAPENTPTTNTGDMDSRPVSFSNLENTLERW